MAEVMSMISEENSPGELNADEQESLQIGEEMEQQQGKMLAGKYKNAEDLESAYLELQKKLGESSDDTEEVSAEQEDQEEEESEAGLFDRLWEEAQGEELSDELADALSNASVGDLAKEYIEYRRQVEESGPTSSMTDEDVTDLKESVGGDENYSRMISWAGDNFSDDEIQLYDSVMDSGNPAAAYFAIQALSMRYDESNGVEGNLLQGKAASDSSRGFRSQAELVQAMSDPRYESDVAYRNDIIRKLENSDIDF